jgi:hypothetical protein
MADDNNSSEIQINVKGLASTAFSSFPNSFLTGPNELKLQITISKDRTVLELKQAIAAKSDVEADRQRLIYSGTSHIFQVGPNSFIRRASGRVLKVGAKFLSLSP